MAFADSRSLGHMTGYKNMEAIPNTMTVARATETFEPDAPSFSTTGAAAITAETPQIDAPVATSKATGLSTCNSSPTATPTA